MSGNFKPPKPAVISFLKINNAPNAKPRIIIPGLLAIPPKKEPAPLATCCFLDTVFLYTLNN